MDVCSQIWLHAFRLMDVPAAFGGANLFIKKHLIIIIVVIIIFFFIFAVDTIKKVIL